MFEWLLESKADKEKRLAAEWEEKLFRGQPSIASSQGEQTPANIVNYKNAYSDIDVVNRCVEFAVNAMAEVPYIVEGERAPKQKLTKLLNVCPNPTNTREQVFRQAYLDYWLDGNAFFYYDGEWLYHLPANKITIIPDSKLWVKRYEYRPIKKEDGFFGLRQEQGEVISFEPKEVIHIKSDSEDSLYRGTPRLKRIQETIETYYALTHFQKQFFQNNAVPGVVLQTENVLSPRIKERVLEQWNKAHSALFKKSKSVAILDGGLQINPLSLATFEEMDFEKSVERLQTDMAVALGIPPLLLNGGNNANIAPNQRLFYNGTILPICRAFCSAFALRFGPGVLVRPDRGAIDALRPDLQQEASYASTLVNGGLITPNEGRARLRYEPITGGDELRVPANIAGSAVDPSQGGRPTEDNE